MNGRAQVTTTQRVTIHGAQASVATEADGLALFRRALDGGDPDAWAAIVSRYRGLVLDWTRRSLRSHIPSEHEDDWVTRAFERFWLAVGSQGNRFRDLPAALQYLKLCVRSVVLDDVRARQSVALEPLDGVDERRVLSLPGAARATPDVESVVVDRLESHDLWQIVLHSLPDADERLVAYLSFVQGLKPAEIATTRRDRFASAADVYRIKRNALERLRRSPRLLARFAPTAAAAAPGALAPAA